MKNFFKKHLTFFITVAAVLVGVSLAVLAVFAMIKNTKAVFSGDRYLSHI